MQTLIGESQDLFAGMVSEPDMASATLRSKETFAEEEQGDDDEDGTLYLRDTTEFLWLSDLQVEDAAEEEEEEEELAS